MSVLEKAYGYDGPNPFAGMNGRDFSDEAIREEFCPTKQFWSMFTHQHEILIGSRGSGKTFLLKMLRRSMLSKVKDPRAKKILDNKSDIAFYISLQTERIAVLNSYKGSEEGAILRFRFLFNCLLALSIVSEATRYCKEVGRESKNKAASMNVDLADILNSAWFMKDDLSELTDLDDLSVKINRMYFDFDFSAGDISLIPRTFTSELCAPLTIAESHLSKFWGADAPNWIVAVDEAEYISELHQKILNSFMRSNSLNIVLKISVLPYYWKTTRTLIDNIDISNGNDFNYLFVDMDCDKDDFRNMTNKLCANRLKRVYTKGEPIIVDTLEEVLGVVGKDNRLDYFKLEMHIDSDDDIKKGILDSLSEKTREGFKDNKNPEQSIYKKFAPIYYVREVLKKKKGKYIPGWFAGSEIVRKVSQGNPRMFINLMGRLFSYASSHRNFSLKDQNKIITEFAIDFCRDSKGIDEYGDVIYENLNTIAKKLRNKTHASNMIEVGCSFKLTDDLTNEEEWLKRAIAFSRLSVSTTEMESGLNKNTKYTLCYAFAVQEWLTMRADYPVTISLYKPERSTGKQLSLFEEDNNEQ